MTARECIVLAVGLLVGFNLTSLLWVWILDRRRA